MIDAYVLCRSSEAAQRLKPYHAFPGIRFSYLEGYDSYYRFILDALSDATSEQVLLLHDDVWLGKGFDSRLSESIAELERYYPNWGLAGNAGITMDGGHIYKYVKDAHGGSHAGRHARPVASVDGNLLLVNRQNVHSRAVNYPDLGGFHGYDLVLGLECLAAGLVVLADPRLVALHESGGNQQAFDAFVQGRTFRDYLTSRFINHRLPSVNGLIDVSEHADFDYLNVDRGDVREDVYDCFDRALQEARGQRKPSLTIGIRSQLQRREMLERALASMSVLGCLHADKLDLRIAIISDAQPEELSAHAAWVSSHFPHVLIQTWHVPEHGGRYSRTNLLIEAFNRCDSDYIWFVDDDDFIMPESVLGVWRRMSPWANNLIVASTSRYLEEWSALPDGTLYLQHSEHEKRIGASEVEKNFLGDNFVPICSAFFPVRIMRERLKNVAALGDYYEDYFLLMLCLTAEEVELEVVDELVAGVSIRSEGNTVTEEDRSHWNFSYASFMGEMVGGHFIDSPALWNTVLDNYATAGSYAELKIRYDDICQGFERLMQWNTVQDEKLLEQSRKYAELNARYEDVRHGFERLMEWNTAQDEKLLEQSRTIARMKKWYLPGLAKSWFFFVKNVFVRFG